MNFLQSACYVILRIKQPISKYNKIKFNYFSSGVTPNFKLENDILESEQFSQMSRRVFKKKPQKEPFAKNLTLGKFDTDILAYPEVLNQGELDELELVASKVRQEIKDTNEKTFIKNYKKFRLFGLQTPQRIGGHELSWTSSCKLLEVISENSDRVGTIYNDQLGIQILLKKGNEFQQEKYLQKLVSGDYLSALCFSEASLTDTKTLNTRAIYNAQNKTWVINGVKNWVINGSIANIFLVFAATESINKVGLIENKFTCFLVDRDSGGISIEHCNPIGLQNTDISNVTFNNTVVSAENIIGPINGGEEIIASCMSGFRLSTGPMCISLTKELLNKYLEHCKLESTSENNLADTDMVKQKISQILVSLYAIESTTYLTCGLLDTYENQDCDLEAALVKVLASELSLGAAQKCLHFIGSPAYFQDHWCNKLYNNALSHVYLNETNDNLKVIIGLIAVQYAGVNIYETVKKIRNPLFHPSESFKRMWDNKRQYEDNPKLHLNLKHFLHPTLTMTSELLEYCVLRLKFSVETLLSRHGTEIINKHVELSRLAAALVDIYGMTACLSRASRSYCIGLEHSEMEITIAHSFCIDAHKRVKENINNICGGPYRTNDENHFKIANYAFNKNMYFPVHATSRNY